MYLALLVPAVLCIVLLYVINHLKKSKPGEQPAPDGGYLSTFPLLLHNFYLKAFEIFHFVAVYYFVPLTEFISSREFYYYC